jgi:hypothetical protein
MLVHHLVGFYQKSVFRGIAIEYFDGISFFCHYFLIFGLVLAYLTGSQATCWLNSRREYDKWLCSFFS